MKTSRLTLAGLAAVLLLLGTPGAAQVGICSDVTAITSVLEKGAELTAGEYDENVLATRQVCGFKLGDWPTAGELLDLNGAIFKPTTVSVFPVSPTTDDYVIVLDDSVAGACDSAAGTATTGCRWTGSVWEAVGDGGAGGGEANTASNLGGGLANFDGKVSVDLQFNSFSSADFALATNLFTIGNNAVTNAQAADMATDTVKLRNASGTGDPEDVKISALTEQASPVAGDFLLCETAAGDLRKCDVGDLPSSGTGFDTITTGTNTAATMTVGTGASIVATGSGAVEATTAEAFAVSGDITMTSTTPTIFLNSSSEDWKVDVLSGVFRLFNTTDVLSRFEIDLIGGTTINPSGSIAGHFTWQSDDNANAFRCQASADSGAGRCGMGTANPEHTFDVQATVAGDATFQVKTTSGEAKIIIDAGGANNDAEIIFEDDDSPRFVIRDDTSLGRLDFESESAANLFMLSFDFTTGAATFNGNGTATADVGVDGDTIDDTFFVDVSTNRVGVGTATPEQLFDVSAASGNAFSMVRSAGVDAFAGYRMKNDAREWVFQVNNTDDFVIRDQTSGINVITVNPIDAQVGIGVADPTSALEVAGDIELTNLLDNDATNFFDGGCSGDEHVTGISSTGLISCATDSGGGGGGDKEFNYPASSLRGGMAPDDSFPAALHDEGTNIDVDTLGYDDTSDECAGGQLTAPGNIDTSGTVTFRAVWYSGTATTGDVLWDIRHSTGQAEGASWDTALTIELATADTTQGTVDLLTVTTWTETVTNLAWVASDTVTFLLCRDVSGDDMVGDAALLHFTVEVPRS